MTRGGSYDADELRALAGALDVLDPEDPDEWSADADAYAASVTRGRERLERRGRARFARDGSATVDPADAAMLRAFLAPDAVIETWVVGGNVASEREWYVGPEVTVVSDPASAGGAEFELAMIDTREVLADVIAFLDVGGVDVAGEPVRLTGDAIHMFSGRETALTDVPFSARRLMNVTAAWEQRPEPRQLQFLDAGRGGLWVVHTIETESETGGAELRPDSDVTDLAAATWAEIVERILATLSR
jgi:hypothetical protein